MPGFDPISMATSALLGSGGGASAAPPGPAGPSLSDETNLTDSTKVGAGGRTKVRGAILRMKKGATINVGVPVSSPAASSSSLPSWVWWVAAAVAALLALWLLLR